MKWSDDRIEALKGLVDQGFTARQIGDDLGVSRNAVIGKVRRSGFSFFNKQGQVKEKPRGRTRRYQTAAPPSRPPGLTALPAESVASPVTFTDLTEVHCRWPVNHMLYCGADRLAGSPYCARHSWIAHHRSAA
jgi:GcrA cell cycle regulator